MALQYAIIFIVADLFHSKIQLLGIPPSFCSFLSTKHEIVCKIINKKKHRERKKWRENHPNGLTINNQIFDRTIFHIVGGCCCCCCCCCPTPLPFQCRKYYLLQYLVRGQTNCSSFSSVSNNNPSDNLWQQHFSCRQQQQFKKIQSEQEEWWR